MCVCVCVCECVHVCVCVCVSVCMCVCVCVISMYVQVIIQLGKILWSTVKGRSVYSCLHTYHTSTYVPTPQIECCCDTDCGTSSEEAGRWAVNRSRQLGSGGLCVE